MRGVESRGNKVGNWRILAVRMALSLGALAATTGIAQAQDATGPVPNPVSTVVKNQLARFQKNMVGGAEAMPAEKYGFKPTADMSSYGHLIMHITQTNYTLCSKLSGGTAPEVKLADTDPKDKLVTALKASFDYCTTSLASADDSKLGEQVQLFGPKPVPRAAAWLGLYGSWNDHYSTQAVYLRLSGILPPSAQH
jgi:hypothetical protein